MTENFKASPNRYNLPTTIGYKKHDLRKKQEPSYSLGSKFPSSNLSEGPGPGKYHPGAHNRYGKENISGHIGMKNYEVLPEKIPAPNTYLLPSPNQYGNKLPNFVIGRKESENFYTGTPGPNAYKTPKSINKPQAPSYSMGTRTEINLISDSPGPKYFPSSGGHCKIHSTLKFRYNEQIENKSPGPGKYNLQNYKPGESTPAYSLRKKL